MYESVVLLNVMVIFMLFTVLVFKNNYYLHAFWILAITWYGVLCMIAQQDLSFCLLMIIFSDIICIFHIDKAIKTKNEVI